MNRCAPLLIGMAVLAGCADETLGPAPESGPKPEALVFLPINSFTMSVVPLDDAFGINAPGAIAGRVGSNAAVYWRGAVTMLPGKAGYTNLVAIDIADNGVIVGSGSSGGHRRGLFWQSTTAPPLDIGALGQVTSPRAINSAGAVVGTFQVADTSTVAHAFRWSRATGMVPIAPPASTQSEAVDISETGIATGTAFFAGDQQVVRWFANGAIGLAGSGIAFRAKSDGSILGFSSIGATLWNPLNRAMAVGPAPRTHIVKQISSTGRNVGTTATGSPRAWTTVGQGATPFILPLPAGAISFASDVNACGTILGSVTLADGTQKRVVWTRTVCDDLPSAAF